MKCKLQRNCEDNELRYLETLFNINNLVFLLRDTLKNPGALTCINSLNALYKHCQLVSIAARTVSLKKKKSRCVSCQFSMFLSSFIAVLVGDEFECQVRCIATKTCQSFNVHHATGKADNRVCELNNIKRQIKPNDFKAMKASNYYGSIKVS